MDWYGLATYAGEGGRRTAFVLGDALYDLTAAYRAARPKESAAPDWVRLGLECLISEYLDRRGDIDELAEATAASVARGQLEPVADGLRRLKAPLRPPRIFAAASNYIEHANEMGTVLAAKANSNPYIFMKADSSVIGPDEAVILPPDSKQVDWEVELGAVIGREARHVPVEAALECVAGYTVINDVSARDLNVRSDFPFKFDWFQGKSFDTFAPLGPWIVPASCIGDPQNLVLQLSVNGEMMQDANTREMIFTVREQIAYLSKILTLRPGDVIATGTPTGVGMGRGIFLKPGDVMEASIELIGRLRNPVSEEVAMHR